MAHPVEAVATSATCLSVCLSTIDRVLSKVHSLEAQHCKGYHKDTPVQR